MAGSEELLARLSGALPRRQSDGDDEAAATRIEDDDGNDHEKEAMAAVVSRCEGVLAEAKSLLDPSSEAGQELLDSVGLELPCILLRYLPISEACRDMSVSILRTLIDFCSPRDMFVVYMEALQMFSEPATLGVCPFILEGLGKIFTRIKKRRVGFFQESMSGLLRTAKTAMEADLHAWPVFDKLICIVTTLYEINTHEQVEEQRERMSRILGAFVFLLLARAGNHEQIDGWKSAVRQVVDLLPYCGFSYTDLLAGSFLQENNDLMNRECCCEDFSMVEIRKGALFAVSWKLCMDEAADKHQILESLRVRLSCSRHVLVETLCNCKILLDPQESSWKLVQHGVSLLATLLGLWSSPVKHASEVSEMECGETPKLMSMLQVLQNIIMYCPNASTRQQAYNCFVKILTEVLSPLERYDTLKTLIINCGHSSMVSLLFYLIKEEVGKGIDLQKSGIAEAEQKPESPFAKEGVLDLVEFVLRPPFGGPPHLPEQIDAVLSVLNLYRFILIKESTGKTNYTGVLSKNNLQKAYNLWFLPLRGVVEALQRSTTQHHDNGGDDDVNACMLLALTNLAGVLYRCIELVEGAF